MEMFTESMWMLWLILTIVFAVVEAVTLGLTTVWCAVGSFVAMILDLFGVPTTIQLVVFVVVSVVFFIICMIWLKPQLDKLQRLQFKPTNADSVLNQEGVVIKSIDPIEGVGQVKVMGQVWSAKADQSIPEGTVVKVLRMEGVKVVVEVI